MKKFGLGTRLLAMMLVLTMLVSYVPSTVWAAAIGDTFSDKDDVGIKAGSLNTSETISWPIKIYDYLNDGMLFEYSYAGDTTITEHGGGAYGGGQAMPMIRGDGIIGVDYTSVNGYYNYSSSAYTAKHAFLNWGSNTAFSVNYDTSADRATEVERSIVQPVKDKSPMFMRWENVAAAGDYSKTYSWVSNFAKDDEQYYSKEDLRYMVMVYKTNEAYGTPVDSNGDGDYDDEGDYNGKGHALRPYWSVSDSSYDTDYSVHSGDIDISDVTDKWGWKSGTNYTGVLSAKQVTVAPSTEWTYVIFDMKTDLQAGVYAASQTITDNNYGIAANWDNISGDCIAGVGIGVPLSITGEVMDVSHIAYFGSEELATYFGERAVMFDKDPGEYMGYVIEMTHSTAGGTASSSHTAPTVSKGLDLTKTTANGGSWSDTAVTRWWGDDALTVGDNKSHDSGGYYYARISNNDTDLDTAYVKYGSTYYNVADYRYITLVYRTNISSPKVGFWLERGTTYAGKGFNGTSYTDKRVSITQSTGQWQTLVYDLAQINNWDTDYNTYFNGSTFDSIGIMFPGFTTSSQYMDIAYVNFASSSSAANTFATNAKNYLNNFAVSDATSVTTTVTRYDGDPDSDYGDELWNMGSNQGFTMLYASKGGGWYYEEDGTTWEGVAGGKNTWSNGYYNYQIGKSYMVGTNASTANNDRTTAAGLGYPVSDSIFLLNTFTGNTSNLLNVTFTDSDGDGYVDTGAERDSMRFKMSHLDLGYTLYNTMKGQGVMTAGLLESSQGEFVGVDGKEYTVLQYKADTVGYIATMLKNTLVIPERDFWGYNYTFVKGTASAMYCEDVDGDGKLDLVDEDKDGDGKLDLVNEDKNGNGRLDESEDLDHDGNLDVNEDKDGDGELDLSEDLDGDGNFDAWEDLNYNGLIDPGEDKDGDGKLDVGEDLDYDGNLDVWEDKNYNDLIDPGEDIDNDGKLDVNEDVNGNGLLDVFNEDRDRDGVLDRTEDLDGDGKFDVWEDLNNNGKLDSGEDIDGDGKLDVDEDIDGDKHFDNVWEDKNYNGVLDDGEDLDGDKKLDRGEDLNKNGRLDSEDFNCNGRLDLGEDIDGDDRLDKTNEDTNGNGKLDLGEDVDGDGNLDVNEDTNGDGGLDVNEDTFIKNGELDKLDLAQALRNLLGIVFTEANYNGQDAATSQATPTASLGSYTDTVSRNVSGKNNGLIGPFLKCKDNIETFYDAAYYLLHNLFVPGSYNQAENDYQYLVMNSAQVPNEEGSYKDAYVFDAGFTNANGQPGTVYDEAGKRIYQTAADDKHKIYYTTEYFTTMAPFLPINDDGEGMDEEFRYNGSPYVRDDQVTTVNAHGATYAGRNYNYVMAANGEFVYHHDDDLFFDFEGDDDVYMYINGELVLDIGAAHSITKVSFDMNDYVDAASAILSNLTGYTADMSDELFAQVLANNGITETKGLTVSSGNYAGTYDMANLKRLHKLNLVDGQSYSIDFYYMERHGWGANMRIATNIVMTDPQMQPGKTAYQGTDANGNLKEVESGGLIDDSKPVDYSFSITNGLKEYNANVKDSNTKLYRLGFQDMNIGVDISADNGLQIFGKETTTVFTAEEGTTLDITGLNGIIELDGVRYRVTVAGNFIGPDQKTTEYLTIPASEEQHILKLYQHNSTEVFKDVDAEVKLGSGTTVKSPSANDDGEYPLELGYINKISVKGVRVTDQSGDLLDPSDLTITVDGFSSQENFEKGIPIDTITIRVSNQEELMQFLTDLQDPKGQTVEGEGVPDGKSSLYWGSGLWKNGTVTISGMWYTLSEEEQEAKVFNNTVKTTAYKSINSADQLVDYASHHVFTPGEPMYYQWANHTVHLELTRFWDDMLATVVDENHTLYQNSAIQALMALRNAEGAGTDTDLSSVAVEIVTANGAAPEIADNYYNNGKWATFPNSTLATQDGYRKIYYKQIYNWSETYIYYWSDTDSTMTQWPGIPMSKLTSEVDGETVEVKAGDGKSIYTVEIPEDARYVIFNNGTNSTVKDQTGNIALSFIEYNAVNFNATDRTLDVHYTSPGMHMFYAKVTSTEVDGVEAMVPVTFYVTDVKDKTYVLDYGLTTEDLNSNGAMFLTDELLGAHSGTAIKFMGLTTTEPTYLDPVTTDATTGKLLLDATQVANGNYNRISFVPGTTTAVDSSEGSTDPSVYMQLEDGKLYMSTPLATGGSAIKYSNGRYVLDSKQMWFTPEKIMDAEYDVWLGLTVHSADAAYAEGDLHYHPLSGTNADANGTGDIDIGAEVQMFKKLTILPATVVYYEDDFLDVDYTGSFVDKTDDKTAGTFVKHGEGSGALTQGVDQDVPYGQDTTYQQSLNGEFSGQSMATINIADKNDKATFSFKGTGFEIISRTNAFDSASFVVEVFEAIKDANGNIVKKDETADKRLPVITEFTSSDVVCKHDHHTPNGYCSYCRNKVSHSYTDGKCTVCNSTEATYYLIGFINGTGQYDTTEYEFVDGKLVTTFDQDSYVMVMDDAGNQYWTNGYPGDAVTSAELFNVGKYTQMENTKDKLHVPGGVEVTLNLMDNGEGGLVLSYFLEPVNLGQRTLFFDISKAGWTGTPNIYYWSESNSMMMSWPGDEMYQYTDEDGNTVENVFYYIVPSDATMVVFNENGGLQTSNETIPGDHYMYEYYAATDTEPAHGVWVRYGIKEEEEEVPTTNTVYFENTDGWQKVYAYYWSEEDTTKTAVEMTQLETGGTRYTCEVPVAATMIQFGRGEADANRTTNTVYYDNTNTAWDTVYAYAWTDTVNNGTFPGVQMTQVSENIWKAEISTDLVNIIFNKGEGGDGNQTGNLTVPEGDHKLYDGTAWTDAMNQTAELTIQGDEFRYEAGNWYDANGLLVESGYNLIYFKNPYATTPKAYYWIDGQPSVYAWPGVDMTQITGTDYYYIKLPNNIDRIIFNDGGSNQTDDLTIDVDTPTYEDGQWTTFVPSVTDRTVYLDNTTNGWTDAYVYFWSNANGAMTQWRGMKMEVNETELVTQADGSQVERIVSFVANIPADAEYVKFVNDTMTKEEAGVPMGGGTFGTSDYFTGDKWASYHDNGYKVYFRNTMGWEKVYAYYWSDESQAMVDWSGLEMTLVAGEDDLYCAVLPLDAQYVIFHNGSKGTGNQTENLEFPGSDYVYSASMWYTLEAEPEIVYYLRGDMNGWDASTAMTKQADGTYAVTLALEPGTYSYKAALANWSWSAPSGDNASVTVETACDVTFVLDVAAGTVTATGDGIAEPDETVYYLRGSMNSWDTSTPMTKQADGTYAVTINLAAGTYEYKGALADWSWSAPSANAIVTVATACDVTFVLDVTAGTITATGDGVEVPVETVYYLRGSMNNWDTSTVMTKQDDGTYAVTLSLVAGTYEYKAAVADWSWSVPSDANASITLSADSSVTFVLDVTAGTVTTSVQEQAVSQVDVDTETTTDTTATQTVATRDLYYENVYGWTAPQVYILDAEGNITHQSMEKVLSDHYLFTVPLDATKVAFTENAVAEADQAALFAEGGSSVALVAELDLYGFSYVWTSYKVEETSENVTVYFDNTSKAWSSVYAYAWNADGNNGDWPGTQMTNVSGNIWSITVPVSMTNIIFNNGSGGDGNQTGDLSIPGDGYKYDGSAWSVYSDTQNTTTVYFDNTGKDWSEIYVHYWRTNADGTTEKNEWPGTKMTLVSGNIYKAEVPVGISNVLFTAGSDGPQTENLTLPGSGYIYGTTLWKDLGGKIIFFANPDGWDKVTMTYGSSSTDTYIDAPGVEMDDLGNGVWSGLVPDGNDIVNFYSDKYMSDSKLPVEDNYYEPAEEDGQLGKWYAFTTGEGKEIQQVPVIRVDDLTYGYYIVEISGMPQYEDDTDWNHILDLQEKISNGEAEQSELDAYLASVTKDTYLYIDGVRIFQPLNTTNDNYSAAENGAAFKELRTMILDGQAAVATYIVNKTAIYTGNYSWTENRNGDFVGSQIQEIDDYLLIGPNNETYINSNLNDQAVIFYVKESYMEGAGHDRTLQIGARALDAGLYTSGKSTGLYATIYQGEAITLPDGTVKYGWQPVTTLLSGTEQYYEIDYTACPYTFDSNGDKVYQVALSVRQGMVSFTSVKTNGLTVLDDLAEESTYTLLDGIYTVEKVEGVMDSGEGEGSTLNFGSVAMQLSIEIEDPEDEQPVEPEQPEVEQPEETVTDPGLTLSYPSLSFEDEIFYNVYFTATDISDVAEMGLMILPSKLTDGTIDDAIGTVPGYVTNGTLYMVKSESIAAAYMGDTVYFKVYAKLTDGTYAYSSVGGYNAKAYANTVLNGDYTDAMKSLVVAMVNYGAEAQQFFGHNTDALVNSALTDAQKALVGSYDESMVDPVVSADSTKTANFVRVNSNFSALYPSVSFDGAFSINYYCTPAITVDSGMTLYYWDAETYASIDAFTIENATGSMEMTESNGQYWGCVSGIAAKDMDKTYYVSCVFESEGETITTGIIAYSLGKYCESKAATDGDAQQAFAQATAVYGYYAKQYFASIA